MNSEDWIVVQKGPRPKKGSAQKSYENQIAYQQRTEGTKRHKYRQQTKQSGLDLTRGRVLKAKDDLTKTLWWQGLLRLLSNACNGKPITSLQCLGIGSFATSPNARHQLGCALLLKELAVNATTLSITDPIMVIEDVRLATELGFAVKDADTFRVQFPKEGSCAILFMPHCGLELNEEILAQCRKQPEGIVLLANSFYEYVSNPQASLCPSSVITDLVAVDAINEQLCPDSTSSTSETAFNDLAVTTIRLV